MEEQSKDKAQDEAQDDAQDKAQDNAQNNTQNNAQDNTKKNANKISEMKSPPPPPRRPLPPPPRIERDRPFAAFRFLVEMEGSGVVVGAFTGFSGVQMRQRMVQARVGNEPRGVKDNYPGITEYEHVTLTKGVIGDNEFLDWVFGSTFPDTVAGPQGRDSYRNINIVALTDTGKRGIVWTLLNAIPAGYRMSPMDASRSEVLTEEIEFAIAGVKRTTAQRNIDSIIDPSAKLPKPYDVGSLLNRGLSQAVQELGNSGNPYEK